MLYKDSADETLSPPFFAFITLVAALPPSLRTTVNISPRNLGNVCVRRIQCVQCPEDHIRSITTAHENAELQRNARIVSRLEDISTLSRTQRSYTVLEHALGSVVHDPGDDDAIRLYAGYLAHPLATILAAREVAPPNDDEGLEQDPG
ncbi:hypothetical protein C8R44DRAFT_881027 [Mycena epipterygia]|nr:hypothetical protein C8R44DRAFT_881027 [Mycena epipterygia]